MSLTKNFQDAVYEMQIKLQEAYDLKDFETAAQMLHDFAKHSKKLEDLELYIQQTSPNKPPIFSSVEEAIDDLEMELEHAFSIKNYKGFKEITDFYIKHREELEDKDVNINKFYFYDEPCLITTMEENNYYCTKTLLSAGINPNIRHKKGITALMKTGSLPHTLALIEAGADVTLKDSRETPTLIHHIKNNWSENTVALKALLNAGANINDTDKSNRTALHWAIAQRKSGLAELLIDEGADLTIQNHNKKTPFMLADRSGLTVIAKKLKNLEGQQPDKLKTPNL